ncbi:hypothetical protein [Microcoleus vaginatus]|uniref:hypothetical protein n=1 Tax=Microcoleus vaginatus TaxID=119532 RepID=UPI00168325D6|nr:hypothetical protein [Microcoleus sp. FACHB-84]
MPIEHYTSPDRKCGHEQNFQRPMPDCQNLNYANLGKQQSLVTKAINIISNNLFY